MKKQHYIDFEFIKEIAEDTIEDVGMDSFPIDVFKMAELLKIPLIKYSEFPLKKRKILLKKSEDGFSFPTENGYLIYYNDKKPATRQRFTILHEIGHVQLEHHGDSSKSEEQKEQEANYFARCLIAPLAIIHLIGVRSPQDIAEIFKISWDCAERIFQTYLKIYQNEEILVKLSNDRMPKLLTKYGGDLKELAKKSHLSESMIRTIYFLYNCSETEEFSTYIYGDENETKKRIYLSKISCRIQCE